MNKKIITIISLLSFIFNSLQVTAIAQNNNSKSSYMLSSSNPTSSSNKLDGSVRYDNIFQPQENIFTGDVEKIKEKEIIKMTVSQVLSSGYTEEGDEFFAEITSEVEGKKGVILPIGTVAHGIVREMAEAKRLGKDGWIELSFDYLITPDGREIPIEGRMTTKMHPVKGVAKAVVEDTAYTLAGGVIGGLTALNLFGIEAAVASQGYTLAGGAAIGGAIGLGISLYRKGSDVLISPGDEIKVKINSPVDLPVISEEALRQDEVHYQGLDVKITNIKLEKDPFGETNTYNISLIIQNNTDKSFSSFDMALMSENKKVFYPSLFGDNTLMMTQIKPNDKISGKICFSVENVKKKHWLVFFDRINRKPLNRISIDNALRDIKLNEKNKKTQKKFTKKVKI